MEIRFADYRFLREELVLYKNDELIPLKRNQALLLDFFLSSPDKIHSKEAIINCVWQDKVVSEQVVFQTISQLRSVFGDAAIRTFSKKGYQWQLPILPTDPISDSASASEKEQMANRQNTSNKFKYLIVSTAIAASLLMGLAFHYTDQSSKKDQASLYTFEDKEPSEESFSAIFKQALKQTTAFSAKIAKTDHRLTSRQSFLTPKLSWQQARLDAQDWLFWGKTYSSDKGTFIHFGLSRNNIHWQSYLFAKDTHRLAKVLAERLNQLEQLGLFSHSMAELDINQLLSMNKKAPSDPDVLLLLADHYINIQHFDVALTYLQRLLHLDSSYASSAYQAKAHWHIGKIYKMRQQFEQATNSLNTMSAILANTPLWALSFENIKTNAWLNYEQSDYDAVFDVLEQGLALGKKQADPLTLFELHILYSILSQKTFNDEKKYQHLSDAQSLLLKHDLDDSNFAVIYYHFALFASDKAKAIPYLERILALPRTADNYWIQDSAFEKLVIYYTERQDFSTALGLFKEPTISAKKLVLKAKVHLADNSNSKIAQPLLQKAFEQARLEYNIHTGLEAALLLYRLSNDPKVRAEYMAYIESNAKPIWLEKHNVILADN
ncbi:winged helix-turn-helix domain-containing protein [Pleionea sp. CnH1-48]|uniref:winged helix-turn-helix domain-containing protein n=1 Tax=Pleionea sp. CnH1-48 TaxID=2954494 RepID=UPI002096A390|nr:winged helix-turn-helix domain-containing protein [Pleionea sp. CnH1-48]MCO7224355.1 winged helix-turn-helix domain-containing protein [Pleionea sp. CnH1-48]